MFSALKPSRDSSTFPVIGLEFLISVALACAAAPTAAPRAKLLGKVLDAAALSKVSAYCVDTSNLKERLNEQDFPQPEAFDVRRMMETESQPKGLLTKLHWKLDSSCSDPGVDAIVRFDFRLQGGILGPGPAPATGKNSHTAPPPQDYWRADLEVSDKASARVIYKAEGNPLNYPLGRTVDNEWDLYHVQRQRAAYYAMAALVSDVEVISKNP